ncbi:hypothetical protein CRUP_024662 [Coryphaenoides rupestris]|nr:hypothetical protein CRUP_024662 [Coryphaenoides rupestris]
MRMVSSDPYTLKVIVRARITDVSLVEPFGSGESVSENVFVPGTPFLVPFSVVTSDVGGNFTIQVTDNRGFISQFPPSLVLADGGSANGTVTLSAPLNTPSGSDVTLTIQAEAPGGGDTNYIVQRFSIVNTVTDFQAPGCRLIRLQGDCSRDCSMFSWELVVDVSDQSGVNRVDRMQGNGTLITSVVALGSGGEDTTRASYTASCCTPDVVLLVVDSVGKCGHLSLQHQGGSHPAGIFVPGHHAHPVLLDLG